jgi:PAS domain S-box-containing protein
VNLVGRSVAVAAAIAAVALAVPGGVGYVALRHSLVDSATEAARDRAERLAAVATSVLQQADERVRMLSLDANVGRYLTDASPDSTRGLDAILPALSAATRFDGDAVSAGVFLVDVRGKPILEVGTTAPHPLTEAAWLARVAAESRPGMELDRGAGTAVLIAYPVVPQASGGAIGALVLRVPNDILLGTSPAAGAAPATLAELAIASGEAARRGGVEARVALPLRPGATTALRPVHLVVAVDLAAANSATRDFVVLMLAIAAGVMAFVVAFSFFAARRVAQSLLDLSMFADGLESVVATNGAIGVPANASGEVVVLAESLNAMLTRMRTAFEVERSAEAARHRAALDAIDEGLITMRPDGVVVSANRAALRMFGCAASEMIRRRFRIATAAQAGRGNGTDRFGLTGEANMAGKTRRLVGRRKDGAEVPIEMSITETSVQGRNLITGVLRDVSERKEAEMTLRRVQAEAKKLALVASRTQNIVVIMDAGGTVEWVNEAFTHLTGYALEEAVGQTPSALFGGPGSPAGDTARIDAAVAAGQGFRTEIRGQSKSGAGYWLEIDGQPVPDKSGKATNFIAVGSEITARKESEDQLRTARDRAEDASRAKSEFLSTVSHELRTPLTSISGALGLLRAGVAGEPSSKMKSMLDIAANNRDRLMQIINDILDVQKIEAGKMDYRMRRVNLAELVRESVEANRTYGRNNGVELVIGEVDENSTVTGDHDRLMQVMANLISNAVKFSPPKGRVEVTVTRRDAEFRITVEDHGAGIPEEFRERIFQKFWQADWSDRRKKGGTGLGLAITKALVDHHQGRIGFESVVGRGTRFHVDLPVEAAPAERAPRVERAAKERGVAS